MGAFNHEHSTSTDFLNNSGYYINLGRLGAKDDSRQLDSQSRLAALNQYYGDLNTERDMANQYQSALDSATLEKIGKQRAGLSAALGDSGSANLVGALQGSNPGIPSFSAHSSTPTTSDLLNLAVQGFNAFQQFQGNQQSIKKAAAETEGLEIDNQSRAAKNIAEIDKLLSDGKISKEQAETLKENLDIIRKTKENTIKQSDEQTKQAQLDTTNKQLLNDYQQTQNDIAVIVKSLNEEQLKQAKFVTEHQLQRYKYDIAEIASRIKSNDASAAASFASASLAITQELGQKLENKLKAAQIPYADKLAKSMAQSADYQAKIAYNNKLISQAAVQQSKNQEVYHSSTVGQYLDFLTEPINSILSPLTKIVK